MRLGPLKIKVAKADTTEAEHWLNDMSNDSVPPPTTTHVSIFNNDANYCTFCGDPTWLYPPTRTVKPIYKELTSVNFTKTCRITEHQPDNSLLFNFCEKCGKGNHTIVRQCFLCRRNQKSPLTTHGL